MTLHHGPTILPTFMPVATQGTMKSLTPTQTASLGITLQLNNAYHLLLRPGMEVLDKAGGAHKFQGWKGNMLTVSATARGRDEGEREGGKEKLIVELGRFAFWAESGCRTAEGEYFFNLSLP